MEILDIATVQCDGQSFRIELYVDSDSPDPLTESPGSGCILSLNHRHRNYQPDAIRQAIAGNTDVIPLSYFEHGLCLWAVAGELPPGASCPWDSVTYAGVWLPDEETLDEAPEGDGPIRREFMLGRARAACEAYTAWCNGEVYGYRIQRVTACGACGSERLELIDSCSGFYSLEACRRDATDAVPKALDLLSLQAGHPG